MQVIPDGIPDKARSDPAIRQVQGTHHAKDVPAKRVCPDDVLDQDGGGHAESLETLPELEKGRFNSYGTRGRLSAKDGLMDWRSNRCRWQPTLRLIGL